MHPILIKSYRYFVVDFSTCETQAFYKDVVFFIDNYNSMFLYNKIKKLMNYVSQGKLALEKNTQVLQIFVWFTFTLKSLILNGGSSLPFQPPSSASLDL